MLNNTAESFENNRPTKKKSNKEEESGVKPENINHNCQNFNHSEVFQVLRLTNDSY